MSPEDYPEEYFYPGLLGTRPELPWYIYPEPDYSEIHDYVYEGDE